MEDKILTEEKVQHYRRYLVEEERSQLTIEKYMRDIHKFMEFLGDQPVNKEVSAAYKINLVETHYAPRSVNSMIAALNGLFSFLGWNACKVKQLRIQKQTYCSEAQELKKQEYQRLLKAAEGTQLHLILQTICGCGIRISELSAFTVEALKEGNIHICCKGKNRTILVPAKLRKRILYHAAKHNITAGPVFVNTYGKPLHRSSIWRQMKRLCEKANVTASKVFPHNLRKLFARTFYQTEKDIAKLADILGHYSIETTRLYIMETGEDHRKRLERLGLIV